MGRPTCLTSISVQYFNIFNATLQPKAETMSNAIASFDAATALQQLAQGPTGRLKAMVNARDFVQSSEENYVQFTFSGFRGANKCRITLRADDTYDLEFFKYNRRTFECPRVTIMGGVYCDMLKDCFENFTGLYLSL
jgi:hypothetical protein